MANARGYDLSAYQRTTPSLAGIDFIIARASISTLTPNGYLTQKDARYDQHIANALKAGCVTGAYHFANRNQNIAQQVADFLRYAGNVPLLFVDVEGANALTFAQTVEFIDRVQAARGHGGLYMSSSVYRWKAGQSYDWLAKWSSTPPLGAWEFWQNDGSGTNHLDDDYFHGSAADLRAFVKLPPAPPSDVGGVMGLKVKLTVTGDANPLNDLGTTKVMTAGALRRVSDDFHLAAPVGKDLGVVQRGLFYGVAGGPTLNPPAAIYATNVDDELYIIQASLCAQLKPLPAAPVPPPPVDNTPYSQQDLDTAEARGKTEGAASEKERLATAEYNRVKAL